MGERIGDARSGSGAGVEADGRRRVRIESVTPQVDCGRFPVKRTDGEDLAVAADIVCDGHDVLRAVLLHRGPGEAEWTETPMTHAGNDRWTASITTVGLGRHRYTIEAWPDRFDTWHRDLGKKAGAGAADHVDLLVGAELAAQAARRAHGTDRRRLRAWAERLAAATDPSEGLAEDLAELVRRYPDRRFAVRFPQELEVVVDRERARFGAWYELFPRSCAPEAGRLGTLRDVEGRLSAVAAMGFDVLYLPPVHPIGTTHRKGRNNARVAGPDDVGSPWAIGSEDGGHTAVHPDLGSMDDFDHLVEAAAAHGLEVALDLAFQCSPDHPWVRKHPEWFRHRPDGTIQYAENPPKRYEDIVPIDFECEAWAELWDELAAVVDFWIAHGVRIFRVDNPHTKSFAFWEWLIARTHDRHPDVVFLSEAFTRPKVMYQLAKLGFTQSYTYFAWRNTRWEIEEYFRELTSTEVAEYFRPNLWPNTPDILTEYLQHGGRAAFAARLILAATLGASYGIYGPAFEHCEARAVAPGSEEYLNSEKYEIRRWSGPGTLSDLVGLVNRIRRDNPCLHADRGLRFHPVTNDALVAYSKCTSDRANAVLVVVNLDPHNVQSGWVDLDLEPLGLDAEHPFQVHDLLTEARYHWRGSRNFVQLDPASVPAHIFRLRRHVRTEHDFEYFL